jgi:putative nucleotidyltransferase with HDIG domain
VLIASLVMNGSMNLLLGYCDDLRSVFFKDSITICGSAVLLLITYLLLFPVERMLGFTSSITLLELSNANTPLLRRLAEEAPGTFQHSIQVANLCAAVASQIGAKSQLVRTGALYHDIGKLYHPVFFTENQNGINPHTRLTNEQSAQIIISHVKEGLALAEKNRLPKVIKDFIATHHGTSVARFFYTQAINKNPGEEIDPGIFTYPGPNPSTAEQAILMMADSVEAASRSMKDVTEENINALVDKVVNAQLEAGYFKNCPITFNDIEAAKEVFKDKLRTIYHTRIQYPELKNKAQG